jgi:hypothetical protein
MIVRILFFALLYSIPIIIYNIIKNKSNKDGTKYCNESCEKILLVYSTIIITIIIAIIIAFIFN